MQRISLEIKVSVLLVIAIAVVLATGYLSYLSLSYIVSSIHKETSPDLVLLNVKDVNHQLDKAENNVRLYDVTGQDSYSQKYNKQVSNITSKVENLYLLAERKQINEAEIDSIYSLIKGRILIWDEMLRLSDEKRTNSTISILTERLTEPEINKKTQQKNFFQRIFQRNKKESNDDINLTKLREEIEDIEKAEILRTDKLKAKEHFLLIKNEELSAKLNLFISKIEEVQTRSLVTKANDANYLAKKTYRWLTLFCFSGVLLIIIVFFVVVNYVKKTKLYQKALIDAKNEALSLSKAKELFIANVSHEIRTPMNAIIGLTDQLLKQEHKKGIKNQLKIVNQSANDLLRIINDILDFSKIQAGKLSFEKIHFKPDEIFRETFELNKILVEQKAVDFQLFIDKKIPNVLIGDPFRLKQIILNLLNNAIKFTAKGNIKLRVTSEVSGKHAVMLKFSIEDTGIGISKEKLPLIFNEFTQTESSTSRDYGGTGLGLAIVSKLVSLQKGTIHVESELDSGTNFIVAIPFKIAKNQNPIHIENRSVDFKNLFVLIVDDEAYNRTLLKVILDRLQITYKESCNGKEAVEEFKNSYFDLVLMDIRMPVMDGIEAAKQIFDWAKNNGREVNIIAISAINSDIEYEKCKSVGIRKVLLKPFKEEELIKSFYQLNDGLKFEQIESSIKETNNKTLDLSELEKLAGGDVNFLKTMLEMFIETSLEGIANFRSDIELGDYEKIADSAHKMVSPNRHLKAHHIVDALKQIETEAVAKNNMNSIIEKVNDVETALKTLITLIKDEMK